MSLDIRFVSLERWPGVPTKTYSRQRSRFATSWPKTIDLLERELEHLKAKDVVIQADCDRDQIRLDGHFRANAKLRGPGVVLSFESKHGPLSYPCDTFTDWQDNVRAIALALEALRTVDRYGVTRNAEQYRGWAALPAPQDTGRFATVEQAAGWLASYTHSKLGMPPSAILTNPEDYEATRKSAAALAHPDRHAGDCIQWNKLQAAVEVLNRHHGV
jgi:hypothetical protein